VAKFTDQFSSYGTWNGNQVNKGNKSISGKNVGGWVAFNKASNVVEFQVGISFVSLDQARLNLKVEGGAFDVVKQDAQVTTCGSLGLFLKNEWEQALGVIQLEGNNDPYQMSKFYTALYHTMMAPTTFRLNIIICDLHN
jgi:putative alpha-1,2-mannosidase